jgi:hypothetical protein
MSEKKFVSRNAVIGLGIICIILAVGLVGATASLESQIASLTTDPNFQAGLLLHLPAPASTYYRAHEFGSLNTILLSLSLDQSKAGDQQSTSVLEGTTINVTGEFQIFNPPQSSGDIRQAFFIYSWTPSWPVPNSNYYQPLYNHVPPTYPGTTQTFNFNLTVPNKEGLYYLFFCFGHQYNMQDAVNQYTKSPLAPHAIIIAGNTHPEP